MASSVEERRKTASESEASRSSVQEDSEPKVAYPQPRPSSQYLMTQKGYLHPMKTYVSLTLFVTGLMSALWFVVGVGPGAQGTIPPAFVLGPSDLYFHSIAIGLASLLIMFVVVEFKIDKYEPSVDFPIAYRATLATIVGAVGAFMYLRPVFHSWFAPLSTAIILLGLLLLADVGGALLLEMYLLPGKLVGRYDSKNNLLGMVPRWNNLPRWADFRKMDGGYWLTLVAGIGTFIAGVIGLVVFWLQYFVVDFNVSSGIFNGLVAWEGGAATFLGAVTGPHSHVIGITLMVGVVALVAKRYGVLDLAGWKRSVAKVGLWVSGTGVAVMTFVYILEGFFQWSPPLLFAYDYGGPISLWSYTAANGLAGDDSTMFWASIGGLILLVPLMLTKFGGKPAWKDPIRMAVLGTWVMAFFATPLEGFVIEFNEQAWSGTPLDMAFGNQQYFALFGLTMAALAFLAMDFFQDKVGARRSIAWFGTLVTGFTVLAGLVYTYVDPGVLAADGSFPTNPTGYVYALGMGLVSVFLVAAAASVARVPHGRLVPPVATITTPVQIPVPVVKASSPGTPSKPVTGPSPAAEVSERE